MSEAPALLVGAPPAQRLAREVAGALGRRTSAAYVRVAVEAESAAPLAWLAAQTGAPRFYWHGRDAPGRVAALGAAVAVGGPDVCALGPALDALGPEARFYGGLRFDPSRPAEPGAWRSAEAGRFTLPRVTFEADDDGRARLVAHLVPGRDRAHRDALVAGLQKLAPPRPLGAALPLPVGRADLPDADGWATTVAAALAAFRAGTLGKVVLARRVTFAFAEPLDPFVLAARLEAATPGTYHVLTSHGPAGPDRSSGAGYFVGASPERLFRQDGRRLLSEAVAGTRPRGGTRADDAALESELLGSEKEAREHGYVRDFLRAALAPLAADLRIGEAPGALTLARGRHLRTPVEATLRAGVGPLDVLAALHPTPAMGGTPTDAALAFLRAHEPFDRGRYAAPVGWISRDAADLAVGIRAGRVEGRALALYSGAGLVEGSQAAAEWAEIEGKIADFVAVLGLDARG